MKALLPKRDVPKEIDRIIDLPIDLRSPDDPSSVADTIQAYTERLKTPKGQWALRPAQALALDVLRRERGLIASISVGGGKTLVSQLAPKVLGIKPYKTVLFTKAKLKDPWIRAREENAKHFEIERSIYLLSYAQLSHPDEGPILLDRLNPDLVICDEAHALAGENSCRRNRFEYYFERNPDTILLAMTGTILKKSIKDYAHIAEIALGKDRTPLPTTHHLMEAFSACLDEKHDSQYAEAYHWEQIQPLVTVFGDRPRNLLDVYPVDQRRKVAREAFFERVSTAPGFVHTSKDTVGAGLEISLITGLRVPSAIVDAIERVEKEYILPNGDEVEDPLAKSRAIKQIAQGCYYFWDWPGEPDFAWLDARRAKAREFRRAIKDGPRRIDSPTLVRRAITDPDIDIFDHDRELLEAYEDWLPHADKPEPPTRPEWISDYMIDDIIKRAQGRGPKKPAIVWYQHRHVAEKLRERGLRWYDPEDGENPELADPKKGPILLSVDSHVEGLNMQYDWSRNLIICPPTDGALWEQLIGRTHRSGQPENTVYVEIYAHVPQFRDALTTARKRARLISEANGQEQKLLIGTWLQLP